MHWLFLVVFITFSIPPAMANSVPEDLHPGFREYQWTDTIRQRTIKVACWYPTREKPAAITYGPFQGHARKNALPAPGKHPLLLVSHGTGGMHFNQFYLAEALAAQGYIVLAVQHPRNCGDNDCDNSDADLLVNLWNRPKDISFTLDQALQNPDLAPYINPDRVGLIGHSLGGYTALVLMGAQPDIDQLDTFCNSLPGMFAGEFCSAKAQELKAWRTGKILDFSHLQDTRFQAALIMAPGVPVLFNKKAMASIHRPLLVFLSGKDEVLKGYEQKYKQYLPDTTHFIEFPQAGHYVYLMECPLSLQARAQEACSDIGTPRATIHPILAKEAISFFANTLKK